MSGAPQLVITQRSAEVRRMKTQLLGHYTTHLDRDYVAQLLTDAPECLGHMTVYDLVRRARFFGPTKARKLLLSEHVSERKRMRELTLRQRYALADKLVRW